MKLVAIIDLSITLHIDAFLNFGAATTIQMTAGRMNELSVITKIFIGSTIKSRLKQNTT